MRYLVFCVVVLAAALTVSGCWFKASGNQVGQAGEKTGKDAIDGSKCLVSLEISRDDNNFKDKNFGDKVAVDDPRFGELTILDATNPKDSATGGEKVGKLVNLTGVDYRDVAVYLVKNQILKTYLHLGSKVCLAGELTDKLDTEYLARFIGTHEFCTNECETGELNFWVMIEKDSGFIYLTK